MGYLKSLTQSNGVTGSYWKIYSIDLLRPDSQEVTVTLANYPDQATADVNPNGILARQQIHIQGTDYPDLTNEISNLYAKIYETINSFSVPTDPNQPTVNNTYFSNAKSDVPVTISGDTLTTATVVQ